MEREQRGAGYDNVLSVTLRTRSTSVLVKLCWPWVSS